VTISLKDRRPFTKSEAETQVGRTFELCVDGAAIFKAVIREPPYIGTLQISGSTIDETYELQARITRAVKAGSSLELAIVD
jgi:hypothetical protein